MKPVVIKWMHLDHKPCKSGNFATNFHNLRKRIKKFQDKAHVDSVALVHDHWLKPPVAHTFFGCPHWDRSSTKRLVKEHENKNKTDVLTLQFHTSYSQSVKPFHWKFSVDTSAMSTFCTCQDHTGWTRRKMRRKARNNKQNEKEFRFGQQWTCCSVVCCLKWICTLAAHSLACIPVLESCLAFSSFHTFKCICETGMLLNPVAWEMTHTNAAHLF